MAGKRGKGAVFALVAGGACLAALPTAVAAVTSSADNAPRSLSLTGSDLGAFTPASADPRLIASLSAAKARRGHDAGMFRFTPAGKDKAGNRAVTVAVRVDADTARAARIGKPAMIGDAASGSGIASVAFNLGMARGYQSFAAPAKVATDLSAGSGKGLAAVDPIASVAAPDLSRFTAIKKSGDSRFGTVIELDDGAEPGLAPRTFGDGERSVDVGGSYRVSGNLRVTAGVRYSDHNRLAPVTDEQQDSQSVYVGTRFRF